MTSRRISGPYPCIPVGEWILVTAAAGGVGIAAVQIAKGALPLSFRWLLFASQPIPSLTSTALGAHVIAAAGSDSKLDVAKRFGGADYTVNYSKPGWQKTVLEITQGKGVNVIYDPVGLINGIFTTYKSWISCGSSFDSGL